MTNNDTDIQLLMWDIISANSDKPWDSKYGSTFFLLKCLFFFKKKYENFPEKSRIKAAVIIMVHRRLLMFGLLKSNMGQHFFLLKCLFFFKKV